VLPVAHIEAKAHRTLTLREDSSVYDRQLLYHQITADLIRALDAELDKNIRQYFANYLM